VRYAYKILVGKTEGKRPLGDLGIDGRKILRMEIGRESVDWMHLAQDRDQGRALVYTEMNLRFPLKVGDVLIS
jgi:hypothetical protein